MIEYVAGFLLDRRGETVWLVRKNRPEWQAGKLNGVGGHIEMHESPAEAMRREFYEEAGLDIDTWDQYASVRGPWGVVYFFRAFGDFNVADNHPRTMTDEPIELHDAQRVPWDAIPNLHWLIPLALYTHDRYLPIEAKEATKHE